MDNSRQTDLQGLGFARKKGLHQHSIIHDALARQTVFHSSKSAIELTSLQRKEETEISYLHLNTGSKSRVNAKQGFREFRALGERIQATKRST